MKLKGLKFNLIFIDADHHYESCKRDFILWNRLLAPDGEIAFHDVDINTVDRVIEEELKNWEIVENKKSCLLACLNHQIYLI